MRALGPEERRSLFVKSWMTHDAIWFAECVRAIGIEKTNATHREGRCFREYAFVL